MAKSVKLGDIAAIVGVSTVTVSKALSDQKGVSEELRSNSWQMRWDTSHHLRSERRRQRKSIILVFSFKRYTLESIRRSIGSYIRYLTKRRWQEAALLCWSLFPEIVY